MDKRSADKQTVSFRLDSDQVSALDSLAEVLDRDRSYLLKEAVSAYIEVQRWQIEQIKASLHQADAGKLIDRREVKRMARKWRG